MTTYIKKIEHRRVVLTFNNVLNPDFYKIGTTFEDYENGLYVRLSEGQVNFYKENPNATIEQIWNMEIPEVVVPERTLEDAKREMLMNIFNYGISKNVNGFTINNTIETWFTVQERLNYKQSVESAKLLNVESLTFFVANQSLQVSTTNAEKMLAALQLYADQCYIVTKQHEIAVKNLTTIEEVDSFNYKADYPNKLNFDLN